jgi:hypothetical protein
MQAANAVLASPIRQVRKRELLDIKAPDIGGFVLLSPIGSHCAIDTSGFLPWPCIQFRPELFPGYPPFRDHDLQELQGDAPLGPPPHGLNADAEALGDPRSPSHILDGQFGGLALCLFHNAIGYTNVYV